ncbi:MAG: hypothetical protein ACPLHI_10940 [Pseudothermotoga sp.]
MIATKIRGLCFAIEPSVAGIILINRQSVLRTISTKMAICFEQSNTEHSFFVRKTFEESN